MTTSVYIRSTTYLKYFRPLAWVGMVVVLFVFELLGMLQFIERGVTTIAKPVLLGTTRVVQAAEWPVHTAVRAHFLARRVQQLEQLYAQSVADLGRLEGVAAENQELRKLLENTDRRIQQSRVAGTLVSLARPAVSVGSDSSVQVGDEVIAGGIFVGTIAEVNPTLSFITLLTQPDHQPIVAKTQSGTRGIIIGTGRTLLLTEVNLEDPLMVGDRVLTSGQPGVLSDLAIGQVVRISDNPSSPVQEAQVEPIVDFYQTRVVEIML